MLNLEVEEARSNIRGVVIFASYLSTCTLLTLLILRDLYVQSTRLSASRRHSDASSRSRSSSSVRPIGVKTAYRIQLFSALAAASLGVTWYYMFGFFSLSYRSWALSKSIPMPTGWREALSTGGSAAAATLRLGPWLRDVRLFREAWEVALERSARLFWSQPIFFAAAAWSVFLGVETHRSAVPRAWAYMLLGQIVAVSFAQNLFFLAVLLFPVRPPQEGGDASGEEKEEGGKEGTAAGGGPAGKEEVKKKKTMAMMKRTPAWTPARSLYAACILLTFISVQLIPWVAGTPLFMRVLILPHVVLVLPALLHRLVPAGAEGRWGVQHASLRAADRYLSSLYEFAFVLAMYSQARAVLEASFFPPEDGHSHRHSNAYRHPMLAEVAGAPQPAAGDILHTLYAALYDHPAVSSVGWDSLLCTLSFLCWKATGRSSGALG